MNDLIPVVPRCPLPEANLSRCNMKQYSLQRDMQLLPLVQEETERNQDENVFHNAQRGIETACAGRQQQRSLLLSAAHSLKGTLGQLTTISSLLARPLCLSPGSGSAISVPPPPVINVVTTTAAALDAKLNLICELF